MSNERNVRLTPGGAVVAVSASIAAIIVGTAVVGMWSVGGDPGEATGAPVAPPPSGSPGASPFAGCGEPVLSPGDAQGPVVMSSDLPDTVVAGHGNTLRGTVTVINTGAEPVTGTTGVQPDIWVVRDGVVVATPAGVRAAGVQLDLAPGASRTFDTSVNLGRCVPGTDQPGDPARAEPLPSGTYQLHAALRVFRPSGPDAALTVRGGPWPLVIG